MRTDEFMASGASPLNYTAPSKSGWHTGLLGFYNEEGGCAFCALATLCPCVAYGMNYSLLTKNNSSNLRACVCPCICFTLLESAGSLCARGNAQQQGASFGHGRSTVTAGSGGLDLNLNAFLILQQYTVVGQRIGADATYACCEVWFCAPCAQTRIRNEVVFQRKKIQFNFEPLQLSEACKHVCCGLTNTCWFAGCVQPMQ